MVDILMFFVAILVTHSVHSLAVKYKKEEPWWLKLYVILALLFAVFIVPGYILMGIADKFDWANETRAYIMLFVSGTLFIGFIKIFPRYEKKIDDQW